MRGLAWGSHEETGNRGVSEHLVPGLVCLKPFGSFEFATLQIRTPAGMARAIGMRDGSRPQRTMREPKIVVRSLRLQNGKGYAAT